MSDISITFEEFIQTALTDRAFRNQLRRNPTQALASIDIVNEELAEALEGFDWDDVDEIASFFEQSDFFVT